MFAPPSSLAPDIKAEWLLDPRITFLNHGSFGATPRVVLDEQTKWLRRLEAEPIEMLNRRRDALQDAAKKEIGKFLGMQPANFGMVTNATDGINAVLRSLNFKPGDELLTTTHVYNAVRQAMRFVAGRTGAAYREIDVPTPVASAGQIERIVIDALTPATRLLVIDHVTSPTALVFPVERIAAACGSRGVDVLVDGAHAPGMLPLNVEQIGAAYYAGNLHKWVCAPKGSAFIWVRPDRQAEIHPLIVSHFFNQGFAAEFSWQGTRDISSWLATPKAIEFLGSIGWERLRAHNNGLAKWAQAILCEHWSVTPLSPLDGSLLGSMCTIPLPAPLNQMSEPAIKQFQQKLYDQERIEVPFFLWQGSVHARPCCAAYTERADIQRLADIISRCQSMCEK